MKTVVLALLSMMGVAGGGAASAAVTYSLSVGNARTAIYNALEGTLSIQQCTTSVFERVSLATADSILDSAYGGFDDAGAHHQFARDLLALDSGIRVFKGTVSVGGSNVDLLFIPYPDNYASLVSVPSGLTCNGGLLINLTDVENDTGDDCVPCSGCQGQTGNCCICTCVSGCGTCYYTGSCSSSNCCGPGWEPWQNPYGDCSAPQSHWDNTTSLTSIGIGNTL
jgi:hypothetical protein